MIVFKIKLYIKCFPHPAKVKRHLIHIREGVPKNKAGFLAIALSLSLRTR